MVERAQIIVRGVVQGVGFRPYVYCLAGDLGLNGYVTNTADGVFIDIEGNRLPEFINRLEQEAPPLAQIRKLSVKSLPFKGYPDFTIQKSADDERANAFTLISPDVSICDDCLKELLDPGNRRYLYPFINCTNCGPRYSITRSIPYDRPNTTMAGFTLCPECLREYQDPTNRRFHAQPNACPTCGPQVEFRVRSSPDRDIRGQAPFGVKKEEALSKTIKLIKKGGIVAIKGIGGFHVACDAANDNAVKGLREKKRKSNKPFAIMVPDVDSAREFCVISPEEEDLLKSARRPIVLLRKKPGPRIPISDLVAPNNDYIGCMLPYTPLHYLLFYYPESNIPQYSNKNPMDTPTFASSPLEGEEKRRGGFFQALVMTSGNLSEEPIVHTNAEAIQKLSGIVDAFLLNSRDIFMRVDDSVLKITGADSRSQDEKSKSTKKNHSEFRTPKSEPIFIRRSRGFAPEAIPLAGEGPEVLGCGADLKNTFTLTKGAVAIPSQHIGDMENFETVRFFEESLENLKAVYRVNPVAIVHDLHPGYLSTRWAIEQGARVRGPGSSVIKTYGIQHHYAHIGSVMAENGIRTKVIGVAFDGTGYGADGNLWGGEFLITDIRGFERVGQFKYIPLPGGESAIREPWRTAVSYVLDAANVQAGKYFERIGFIEKYGKRNIEELVKISELKEFSPLSSGAGRLFDAVSALLGLCDVNTFEGEAAIALESLVDETIPDHYPVEFRDENGYCIIDFSRTIRGILEDMLGGKVKNIIATRFHNTVVESVISLVKKLSLEHSIKTVALSGGTFQNVYLLNRTATLLRAEGLSVFFNHKVPSNDAGISLGQAYIVRERLKSA